MLDFGLNCSLGGKKVTKGGILPFRRAATTPRRLN